MHTDLLSYDLNHRILGESRAFEFDDLALQYTMKILNEYRQEYETLSPIEKLFIQMTLTHSEDLQSQLLGIIS